MLDIKEAKQMMSEAIQEKDSSEIRIILERLIVLRAMQTALALEAWNTKYGKPTRTMIGLESRRYMEDCKKLIDSVEHSLS